MEREQNVMEVLGFPQFLCYSHKSQLRIECQKILRLAYACDFIAQVSLQKIYQSTISLFLKALSKMEAEFTNEIRFLKERVLVRQLNQFRPKEGSKKPT